ncbi:multidrug effflux MFS transporter [Pseudoduganella sp. GCM10020061]|uniref:multidrug effflux MFS transporter n=1 Tax=Pseudoduganella sp. GCM10020061 TaxID=3317345 RepID=UPI003632947C
MFPPQPPSLPPDEPDTQPVPPPPPHPVKVLSATGLAVVLACLSMLGPFSIDTYLPAFPDIQASLRASPLEVQQTLTAYMLAFSGMVLWHGSISDAFGRRNVILISLVVFAIGTLGCASAYTVHYLWVFRILQGVSAGAGVVVGRAIIRDLYHGAPAARLLSMVTMIFSIAPAVAPILGGWVVKFTNWRVIFLLLLAYTIVLFWVCWRRLPETLPQEKRQPFNPRFLWHSYSTIFRSPLFHMKAGLVACNFAGLFVYITAAPVMLPQSLHLGPDQFGWLFIPAVSGIFFGALLANRLAGHTPIQTQIRLGFVCMLSAAAANVLFHALHAPALPWTVAPLFFYTFGMSIVAPGATLLALDLFPHIRGTVASAQSSASTLLAAVVAGVIAPALSHSVLLLSIGQLVFALAGVGLWIASRHYKRRTEPGLPG